MHVIIAGYTGLTGSFALAQLQAHQGVDKIICVGRRPPEVMHKVEFVSLDNVQGKVGSPEATAVICCVGTTMAKAGSKSAFRQVDYDIPVRLAEWTRERASRFVLMSSVGANAAASNFYLRVKGETEVAVRDAFKGPVCVLRPSMLLGPRKEKRVGERIGISLSGLVAPVLPANYKPVHVKDVAAAMVHLATHDQQAGIYHYTDIMRFASSAR